MLHIKAKLDANWLLWLFLIAVMVSGCGETNTPTPTATSTPTATLTPTNTPTATSTPTPTNTLTPTPTSTPTATPTPTATNTPTPTDTPTPTASPTPIPTASATPIPQTTPVSPTPTEEATPDTITLYYRSNPNEVLGVFPVRPFDANGIYNNMLNMRQSLNTMKASIDGAHGGDANACNAYVNAYNTILNSGVFYDEVPGDWEEIDFAYVLSFIFSLDRTRPAYLSCIDSGQVDDFNYGLAAQTIEQTLNFLNPFIDAAASKL